MGRRGRVFAQACGQGDVLRQGRAGQELPKLAKVGLRPAVTEAGGDRRCGGGIGQHGRGAEDALRQAPAWAEEARQQVDGLSGELRALGREQVRLSDELRQVLQERLALLAQLAQLVTPGHEGPVDLWAAWGAWREDPRGEPPASYG